MHDFSHVAMTDSAVKMTPVHRDFTLQVTRGRLNLFPSTVLLLLLAVLALLNHFRGIKKTEEAPATISSLLRRGILQHVISKPRR